MTDLPRRPRSDDDAAAPLVVVCLCAAWCGVCQAYRPTFEAVVAGFGAAVEPVLPTPPTATTSPIASVASLATSSDAADRRAAVRAVWLDIEDDAEALGELDVVDFPTLVIGRGAEPLFAGPLTPQPAVLQRLLERAASRELAPLRGSPDTARLLARLALPGDPAAPSPATTECPR